MSLLWLLHHRLHGVSRKSRGEKTKTKQTAQKKKIVGKLTRVLHPITGASLPVVVAEHVLSDYGTGAVMGVPWHDDRDAAFAKANGISFGDPVLNDSGTHLINSGPFSGLSVAEAREKLAAKLEAENVGIQHTSFKLRDWLVSRQRPWGAPIPVIHCKTCGPVPVPERDLPVRFFFFFFFFFCKHILFCKRFRWPLATI